MQKAKKPTTTRLRGASHGNQPMSLLLFLQKERLLVKRELFRFVTLPSGHRYKPSLFTTNHRRNQNPPRPSHLDGVLAPVIRAPSGAHCRARAFVWCFHLEKTRDLVFFLKEKSAFCYRPTARPLAYSDGCWTRPLGRGKAHSHRRFAFCRRPDTQRSRGLLVPVGPSHRCVRAQA